MKKIRTAYFRAYGRAIVLLMALAGLITSGCKSIRNGQRNSMKITPCDSSEVAEVVPLYGAIRISKPESYGSIFGRVLNAENGRPIVNATVRLYIDKCPQKWGYSQKDGSFQVLYADNIERQSEYKLVITPYDKMNFVYENNEILLKAAGATKNKFSDTIICNITVKRKSNAPK